MKKFYATLIFVLLLLPFNLFSQNFGEVELIYKQIDTIKLKMIIVHPENFDKAKKYPAIVFFFGGGWVSGTINQFRPFANHCASKGMIAVLVDYRVSSRQKTTPFESVKDARSAFRYVRGNAGKLSIDPNKIVASGGSAGGHLAAACATDETINEISDNLKISPVPSALILFNPVIDNSKVGYGYERVGERYPEFSPMHNIKKGFPPTIFFVGTKDNLIPVKTAQTFKQKIDSVGSRCDVYFYEGQPHGFFNKTTFHPDIFEKMDAFLSSHGYITTVN